MRFSYPRIRKTIGTALTVGVVALAGVALLTGGASGAQRNQTVQSKGTEDFTPNVRVFSSLHFHPGKTNIASGGTLTFTHADDTEDPHTLTIIDASEMPDNIDEVFGCGEPGTVCDDLFQLVTTDPPPPFINGPGTGPGIDGRLDTLFVGPGDSASAPVTAPAGTTLEYFCAIHPWMQGELTVK